MAIQADVAVFAACLGLAVALISWGTWRVCRELGELEHRPRPMPTLYNREGRMKRTSAILLALAVAAGVFLAFDGIAIASKIIGNG